MGMCMNGIWMVGICGIRITRDQHYICMLSSCFIVCIRICIIIMLKGILVCLVINWLYMNGMDYIVLCGLLVRQYYLKYLDCF